MLGSRSVPIINVGLVLFEIATWGCSRPPQGPSAEIDSRSRTSASLRLLVTGDVAGTIEPCGCVKDQLGGLDRFATAVLTAHRNHSTLFLEAGALLFPRSSIETDERDESLLRAQTLAKVMRGLGLLTWAPGKADWALGEPTLVELTKQSGAKLLQSAIRDGATVSGSEGCVLTNAGGVKVGICGIGSQLTSALTHPDDLLNNLEEAAKELETKGARLSIAMLNAPSGTAAIVAQRISSFQVIIVGGTSERSLGADSDGAEPQLVGSTLILEPPNHLRGLVAVDFTVIGEKYSFQDGSGIGRDEERVEVAHRIVDLAERVQVWKNQNQDKSLLAAREADLKRLQQRYFELSKPVELPKVSYFTIQTFAIGNGVPGDPAVRTTLDELGGRINLNNREKFSGRKAPPATEGQPTFVGVDACETCHPNATKFWRSTHHATAYRTLVNKDRQYTLECVGCHVTGYEQPGGSSVTDVAELQDVQCETCHGPGSVHSKTTSKDTITRKPDQQLCANRCHHSPHVAPTWTVTEAWPKILGEGHGK